MVMFPRHVQRRALAQSVGPTCRQSITYVRGWRGAAAVPLVARAAGPLRTPQRTCMSSLQTPEVSAKLLELTESFAEARELIGEAKESARTVYAVEDLQDAKEQTEKTLALWKELQEYLEKLGDAAALDRLKKEHDVKMSQLRAELEDAQDFISHD